MSRTFNYSGTPSLKENQKVKEIYAMTKKEFQHRIIKNVVHRPEYIKLINYGLNELTPEERERLIATFIENGVKEPVREDDICAIVYAIAERASKCQ